jgi:cytochrome c553
MSTWCSGCHQAYDNKQSTYNYGGYEAVDATRSAGGLTPGVGVAVGDRNRHRHPVNIPIATVATLNGWGSDAITSTVLPLEKSAATAGNATWSTQDYIGCLTCHRAHGTQVAMDGWAVSSLANNASGVVTWYPVMATATVPSGVNPNFSSALLLVGIAQWKCIR